MTQHDLHIADQLTPAFRSDLNNALLALASNASGPAEPNVTVAGMLWMDTTSSILKLRDETNADWLAIARIDSDANTVRLDVRGLRSFNNNGIVIENTAGDEILKLIPATRDEAIEGLDDQKIITPQTLRAVLPLGNPTSITTYTEQTSFDLPNSTKAMLIQVSGQGGGGAASTGYEQERDGVMLPTFDHGHQGRGTQVVIIDISTNPASILENFVGGGGRGGSASSDAPEFDTVRQRTETEAEINGNGAPGGQGVTFGATDRIAQNGANGSLYQAFTASENLGGKRVQVNFFEGGQAGNLKTADGAREGEKERPQGQAGHPGYAIVWIWS